MLTLNQYKKNSTILDQFVRTDELLMLKVIEENQRNDFNLKKLN
jgi:hypothetical protein